MESVKACTNYGDLAPTPKELKMCGVCNMSMAISTVVSHIWVRHMQVKPYQCSVCFKDFGYSESTRGRKHALRHNELGGELINNKQKFKEQYKEWRDRCFDTNADENKDLLQVASPSSLKPPASSISPSLLPQELETSDLDSPAFPSGRTRAAGGTDGPLKLPGRRQTDPAGARQCHKCGAMVNRGNKYAHVWLHYGVKPIRCSECGKEFGFSALSGATKHINEKHIDATMIDKREEHRAAVRNMRQECFPVEETNQETEQPEQKRAKLAPVVDAVSTCNLDANEAATELDQKPTIEQLQSIRMTAKERDLKEALSVIRTLQGQLSGSKEELSATKEELSATKEELSATKEELKAQEHLVDVVKQVTCSEAAELTQLKFKTAELEFSKKSLEQQNSQLQQQRDQWIHGKEELDELRNTTAQLQSRNDSLEQQNAQLQQKIREKDQYINAVKQFVSHHPSG